MGAVILYIEDNRDNRVLVKRAIEAIGHQLIEAVDGKDGIEKAKALDPDIILLDINLPDIDGYQVARALRSSGLSHLVYVPVIAVTANALRGDAEKALEAGCDIYMVKPISIPDLWARVESLLASVGKANGSMPDF